MRYSSLIGLLFGVLVFCFTLYCICQGNIESKEIESVILLMCTCVPQITSYTVCGSYLSDKVRNFKIAGHGLFHQVSTLARGVFAQPSGACKTLNPSYMLYGFQKESIHSLNKIIFKKLFIKYL